MFPSIFWAVPLVEKAEACCFAVNAFSPDNTTWPSTAVTPLPASPPHLPSPARGRTLCVCRCLVDGASHLLKFNERVCVQPFKLLRSSKYNTCPKTAFKVCKHEFWRSFNQGNLRNTSWASICFWQMTRAGDTFSFITCFKLFTCESFRGCVTRNTWNAADYDAQRVVFQDSRLKCNGKSRGGREVLQMLKVL